MNEQKEQSTRMRIHEAGKQEFLQKGFLAASLRNIVKNAGVTTGAFYGYYSSKEELFAALVEEQAEYVLHLFDSTIDELEHLSGEEQTKQMTDLSGDAVMRMIDYIYDNYDAFKLIMLCAEGTQYADFIHQIVEREEESTYTYIETLKKIGYSVEPINRQLIHMVASGLFTGIFETIVHDMPKAEAKEYVVQLERFCTAGWEELLGVKFGNK
ncbi:MAG: TetR/AcrR family transcriptional regulator [Roseburia sp.]